MKSKLTLLIVLIEILFSCSKKPEENIYYPSSIDKTTSIELEVSEKIEKISDLYFTSIPAIESYRQNYFIADQDRAQLIKTDKSFKIIESFGKEGSGPGEFANVNVFSVHKDRILIHDGLKFIMYDINGNYRTQFDLEFRCCRGGKFAFNGTHVFYCAFNEPNNFVSIEVESKRVENIGSRFETILVEDPLEHLARTAIFGKNLLAVSKHHPVISLLTLQGELISENCYMKHPAFKKFEYFSQELKRKNSAAYPIWSEYIDVKGENIYVLFSVPSKEGGFLSNKVGKFIFRNNQIKLEMIYSLLEECYFYAIDVQPDQIIATCGEDSSIHLYNY